MPTDTERLDFLQKNRMTVFVWFEPNETLSTSGDGVRQHRDDFLGWAVTGDDSPHPTIRAAIDSAMAK